MKKSYNPFNMWGSYIGAMIGWTTGLLFPLLDKQMYYLYGIIGLISGFIIGWGIHNLFRSLK